MSNQDFNGGSRIEDGLSGLDSAAGSDVFTETASRSWFQRIGDSLKGIVIGVILVIAAGFLMFWNEGRSAKTSAALSEGLGQVVAVSSEKIDPSNEGKLVHLAGDTVSAQGARDPDFGFATKGLKVERKVEMYVWKEESHSETQKKLGGGEETVTRYSYKREWSDRAVDSSRFRSASDHRNPPMPNLASRDFSASDARLGAFRVSENVIGLLSAREKLDVPETALAQARNRLGGRTRIAQGIVYSGDNPDQPNVGDVRVSWNLLPLTPVSIVGRQTQSDLTPWTARNGNQVLMAETGTVDAQTMFRHGEEENAMLTWILRIVGIVLMFAGFRALLSLFEVLADIVPFFGNIVGAGASLIALLLTLICAPLIIAAAWLFYRPLIAIGIIVVGGALAYGARQLVRRASASKAGGRLPAGTGIQGAAPR